MAEKKITQLNPASVPLDGTEQVELVQGGFSVRASTSAIANAFSTVLVASKGGTGFSSYTIGDLIYADTSSTLAKLADVATGKVLISGGVGVAPAWGQADLTSAVTGVLPVPNGGSGAATLTGYLKGNGASAFTASSTIPVADLLGTISVPNGGTGAATLTGYIKGNGTSAMTASATIPYADLAGRAFLSSYSTANQTGTVGSANPIQFPSTDAGFSQGISMTQNGGGLYTRVTFAAAGTYMVAPSLQFVNSAASDHDATVWFAQNGTAIPNSGTIITIPKAGDGGAGLFQIVFYVKTTTANEYVEVMWNPENVSVTLAFISATGPAPGIPSAIVVSERIA
jgi:hypothetical protein